MPEISLYVTYAYMSRIDIIDLLMKKPFLMSMRSIESWAVIIGGTNMIWINVNKKLPDDDGYYIIYHHLPGVHFAWFYEDHQRFYERCASAESIDDITHWMPLPERPE